MAIAAARHFQHLYRTRSDSGERSRSTTSGVQGSSLSGGTTETFTDSTPLNAVTYYYECVITDSAGSPASVTSNQIALTPAGALVAGTAAAVPGSNSVALTLTGTSGGTPSYTYQWYRSTTSGVQGSSLSGGTTASYTDSTAVNGTTYYYECVVTDSVSATATSNQVSATPAASTTTLFVSDSHFYYPKLGWFYDPTANSGNGVLQTVNTGNILKFGLTTTATGSIVINTDGSTNGHSTFAAAIDGGAWSYFNTTNGTAAITLFSGVTAGSHEILIMVSACDQSTDHWGSSGVLPTNCVRVFGFTVPASSTLFTPTTYYPIRPKRGLLYGDSITQGINTSTSNPGADGEDATVPYPVYLIPALHAEFSVVGFGFQGYTHSGSDSVTPPIYTPGNAAASAWDKFDATNSRLSSGVFLANSTEPLDYVVLLQGTNDRSATQSTVQANAQGLLPLLRTAAPSAAIYQCIPFGSASGAEYCQSALTSAVSGYKAAHPSDAKTYLIDFAANTDLTISNMIQQNMTDSLHPNVTGHKYLGIAMAAAILNDNSTTVATGVFPVIGSVFIRGIV